jgi:hypothetical protein
VVLLAVFLVLVRWHRHAPDAQAPLRALTRFPAPALRPAGWQSGCFAAEDAYVLPRLHGVRRQIAPALGERCQTPTACAILLAATVISSRRRASAC